MIVFRVLRAFLLAASGAVVTLAQLNLPDDFWGKHEEVQWASVLVLAVIIGIETVHEVNYFLQARQIREYDKDLRSVLSGVIGRVVLTSGTPWDQLAVRYYRQRSLLHRRHLGPVAAIMAGADVEEPRRAIRSGAGLVGAAFSGQEVIAEEWGAFVRTATEQGRHAWEQRSEQQRYGLSWGQLRRSPQPEGMIASPTFAVNGDPDGCILLSGDLKLPILTSEATRRILDDLATALDRLGPPPRGWWSAHER